MNSHLTKLREITDTLSLFPPAVIERPGYKEFKVKNGKCFAWHLYSQEQIAVCRVFLSKDTVFPKHFHPEKEVLIVYEGKIIIYTEDNCYEVGQYETYIIEPGIPHAVHAEENSMVLAITIPASKEFPRDTKN